MMVYQPIDPVALDLGILQIRWYGLMYLIGFLGGWLYGVQRAKDAWRGWQAEQVGDVLFYIAMGVILGGRMGYILFYDFSHYLAFPLDMLKIWQGGMSFHGGLLGVITAVWFYSRKVNKNLLEITDFIAPFVVIGLFFGRLGNYINSELWGKQAPEDSPWAMMVYDPQLQTLVAKYPTQLLEALLEGLVLGVLLWWYSRQQRALGAVSGLFLLGYGSFRFLVEFWRMPDVQLGYLAWDWLTMGQVLCLPMIVGGVFLMTRHRWVKQAVSASLN
jgi:phosphatidylglycerol:prolipoprotein diacylglycerol transferase